MQSLDKLIFALSKKVHTEEHALNLNLKFLVHIFIHYQDVGIFMYFFLL